MASVGNTFIGKVGDIYVVPFGTAAPFTIPPDNTNDVTAALPAAWLDGELGYLHEDDTPVFSNDITTERIGAWQIDGGTLRTTRTQRARTVTFTCRELNRNTWGLIEPGSSYTAGAAGNTTVAVPSTGGNPPLALLFDIQDTDLGNRIKIYIPRATVTEIGDLQYVNADTANVVVTFEMENNDTDTLYYVLTSADGLVTP